MKGFAINTWSLTASDVTGQGEVTADGDYTHTAAGMIGLDAEKTSTHTQTAVASFHTQRRGGRHLLSPAAASAARAPGGNLR